MSDVRMYKDYVGVSMYNSSFYLGGQHVVFMLLDGGITLGTHVEYDNEMEIIPPLNVGMIFNHLYYSRLPLTRSTVIDGPVTGNICFNIVTAAGAAVYVNYVWVELFFEDYQNKRYPISGGDVKINHSTISQLTGPAEKMVGLYFEFPVHQVKAIPGAHLALRVKAYGNRVGNGKIQQLVSKDDRDILVSLPLIGA